MYLALLGGRTHNQVVNIPSGGPLGLMPVLQQSELSDTDYIEKRKILNKSVHLIAEFKNRLVHKALYIMRSGINNSQSCTYIVHNTYVSQQSDDNGERIMHIQ